MFAATGVAPQFASESSDTQYGVEGTKARVSVRLVLPSGPGGQRVRPAATWYLGGQRLEMGERLTGSLTAAGDLCLEINGFSAADVGEYKVHVENQFGAVSQLINVDMAGRWPTPFSRRPLLLNADRPPKNDH